MRKHLPNSLEELNTVYRPITVEVKTVTVSLEEELSEETVEVLQRIGSKFRYQLNEKQRKRYFLSEGAGMELWWMLKARYFEPEKLEKCKSELIERDLLTIEEYENLPPYYVRFQGELNLRPKAKDMSDYSRGHVQMRVEEEKTVIRFTKELIEKYRNSKLDETFTEFVDGAMNYYRLIKESDEEIHTYLQNEGIFLRDIESDLKDDRVKDVLADLESRGLVNVEEKVEEEDKHRYFITKWVQRDDKTFRFFFSPEVYSNFFR